MRGELAKMKSVLLALPLVLAVAGAMAQPGRECRDKPLPASNTGEAFAVDGDTLAFAGQPRVRLWGIQAPELRDKASQRESRAGMQAREALDEMLAKDRAHTICTPAKWDRYCRLVATCTASGTDLSRALLDRGMAYTGWLEDTVRGQPSLSAAYAAAETTARRERRGLWKVWLGD